MSENTELWAAMGCVRHGTQRMIWKSKPDPHGNGCGCWTGREHWLARDYEQAEFFNLIFPEGIDPGECKRITLERAKIVEEDK